ANVAGINTSQLMVLNTRVPKRGAPPGRDTIDVVLFNRRNAAADTVAGILGVPMRRRSSVDAAGRVIEHEEVMGAIPVSESASLFEDGWLALVHLDPFRVDWRRPDGTCVKGAPLPIERVR